MNILEENKLKSYKKSGVFYELIERGEKSVIFEMTDIEDNNKVLGYEVGYVRFLKEGSVKFGGSNEKWYPAREAFPSTEQFGSLAWGPVLKSRAYEIFNRLESGVESE